MPRKNPDENLTAPPFETLEAFVEESTRRCVAKGYHPEIFLRMRREYGLERVIEKLVENSELQSGFTRLKKLNMLEWSLEQAVIYYPDRFKPKTREYAGFRLSHIKDRKLRTSGPR